uniref:Uncharacterized protein n=1 Tax=Romanomermis culicivorax TaxID=13658 RepID=A0A915HXH0_ROMCU
MIEHRQTTMITKRLRKSFSLNCMIIWIQRPIPLSDQRNNSQICIGREILELETTPFYREE